MQGEVKNCVVVARSPEDGISFGPQGLTIAKPAGYVVVPRECIPDADAFLGSLKMGPSPEAAAPNSDQVETLQWLTLVDRFQNKLEIAARRGEMRVTIGRDDGEPEVFNMTREAAGWVAGFLLGGRGTDKSPMVVQCEGNIAWITQDMIQRGVKYLNDSGLLCSGDIDDRGREATDSQIRGILMAVLTGQSDLDRD